MSRDAGFGGCRGARQTLAKLTLDGEIRGGRRPRTSDRTAAAAAAAATERGRKKKARQRQASCRALPGVESGCGE